MRLPDALPPANGNSHADDDAAAVMGHFLFFDARLSSNGEVRCATCHVPENVFDDGQPTSTGLQTVTRNSPSLFTAPWLSWQMWDGKADSMWMQPLLAFENPKEMGFTRLELAHRAQLTYRASYEALFGPLPPLEDTARFPPQGKPGDVAFDGMSAADQLEVNRVVANLGKALEAYERKLALRPGRFDRFLDGDASSLSPQEREGLRVFFAAGCDACHRGPMLSDEAFHALQVPLAEGQVFERGRAAALEFLALSPFNAAGVFHEGPSGQVPTPTPEDEGAFRTAPLRNVARTAPYGHNGVLATLETAVDFHLPSKVTKTERAALLAFLLALDAGDPPKPWNGWPNR
jgi:cytochrome c peroxidase